MDIKCIACGRSKLIAKIKSVSWEIMQCKNCGLGITKTLHGEHNREEIYDENYFDEHYPPSAYSKVYEKNRFEGILKKIARRMPPGRLLDIGCGTGDFLALAKEAGWEIYGSDISPFAIDYASKKLGIKILRGKLDNIFPEEYFDLVTLQHTIEHMINPFDCLLSVFRILKKNGMVFIEVPNFRSLEVFVYGDKWEDLRPDEHLYHFTPRSITMLLEKANFRIVELETKITAFWHFRNSFFYLNILWNYFSEKSQFLKRNQHSCRASSKLHPYPCLVGCLNYASWVIFRPVTWYEENLKLGKRLIVFAQKIA